MAGYGDASQQDATGARGTAQEFASAARDRFVRDLQDLSAHAHELLRVTSTISEQGVAAARAQLVQSLGSIGDSLKRWQDEAITQGRRIADRTDSYVHENPWPAIGAGVLVGVALGVAGGSLARGSSAGAASGSSGSASNARH
jgi:ElaB/YqjD/DUF883 family membrane-anchored ribosome-binding protein